MEQTIFNAAGVEKRYKTFTLKPTDLEMCIRDRFHSTY